MALILQMVSLVVCRASIDARYPGGWMAFSAAYPDAVRYRSDSELVRFEEMGPYLGPLIEQLLKNGLRLCTSHEPGDMACDPLETVPWLELGTFLQVDGYRLLVCRLRGGSDHFVRKPDDPDFAPPFELVPGAQFEPWTGPKWEPTYSGLDGERSVDRVTGMERVFFDSSRTFTIALVAAGPDRIRVMKELRQLLGIGVAEAQRMVNAVPTTLLTGANGSVGRGPQAATH